MFGLLGSVDAVCAFVLAGLVAISLGVWGWCCLVFASWVCCYWLMVLSCLVVRFGGGGFCSLFVGGCCLCCGLLV